MKLIITLLLMVCFSTSFSQWTRVEQLPASNIFSLYHKDSSLYAGGTNVIYISHNKGLTWDTTAAIPDLSANTSLVNNIIVYRNELYVSAPDVGVFKSLDDGATWLNISFGIFPQVTDICEYRGNLYACTEGNFANPIFKLDSVSRTHWLSFNDGLSSISTVVTSIIGTSKTLVAGTNNNGLYDYLLGNSATWEERFLTNPVSTAEGAFDIITAHDTLFFAGKTGRFFISTDNGLTWHLFGNRLVTGATFIANAKQALISSRYIFDGTNNITLFYYIKKDSLQFPFHNFSVVGDHFTWKVDVLGNKLWDASDRGLFYMSLSDLPGISGEDDSLPAVLPVLFTQFNATCAGNEVLLTWKTAQEQNSRRFDIERSEDGIRWTVIGTLAAAGNSNIERTYSFTDNDPFLNAFYRIAEVDLDGSVRYTDTIRTSCTIPTDSFSLLPNPVHNRIFISIGTTIASQAYIKIYDSKGALVKLQNTNVLPGNNRLMVDVSSFANGVYLVSAEWKNGQMKKTVRVIKQ